MSWFETKIIYSKMMENGVQKKVTESYLVDALSCTEAEARTLKEMEPYINGEFSISSVKQAKYSEVFLDESDSADRWFKCKVAFITLDDNTGAERETSTYMLVQATNLRKAVERLDKGMRGCMTEYLIKSISETKIMDVFLFNQESDKELLNAYMDRRLADNTLETHFKKEREAHNE